MTNKFRFWVTSSPKTLKFINISRESEKGAKNSYGSPTYSLTPREVLNRNFSLM
jgi:hypothetical protein